MKQLPGTARLAALSLLIGLLFVALPFFTAAGQRGAGSQLAAQLPSLAAVDANELPLSNMSDWPTTAGSLEGVSYSFSYPPGWGPGLTYCAPGAPAGDEGGHLPAGCVSTDFLAGQKLLDVAGINGTPLMVDGRRASRQVDLQPSNVLVSGIYTVIVYAEPGRPLFGFSANIGPGTSTKRRDDIIESLHAVLTTLSLEERQ